MKRFETDPEKLFRVAEAEVRADEENDGLPCEAVQSQVIGVLAAKLAGANRKLNVLARFMEMTMETQP